MAELNALLEQNERNLERARGHVANLAGLKTPLATLAMALGARDPDGALAAQVADMDRRMRHTCAGRARPPWPGPGPGPHGARPRLSDLREVLVRLHAERRPVIALDVPEELRCL